MRSINTRTDEAYNQKYLGQMDAEYIRGYDAALEDIVTMFDNLDLYEENFDFDEVDINLARYLQKPMHEKEREMLVNIIKDWHESKRDDIIVSILDSMDDEEYERAKCEVDSGTRKPYFVKKWTD